MANNNISPEERLFKVIQDSKNNLSGSEDSIQKKINPLGGWHPERIKQFFSNLNPVRRKLSDGVKVEPGAKLKAPGLAGQSAWPIGLGEIDFEAANRTLAIILAILTVMVLYTLIYKRSSIAKISDAVAKIHAQLIKKKAVEAFNPPVFYINQIEKRDIFRPLPRVEGKEFLVTPRVKEVQAKLQETAKDFKLVGISWGNYPRVMIKSEKEQKTYFLKQGQTIGMTGIEVKTIFKDRIVISYQGTEIELL